MLFTRLIFLTLTMSGLYGSVASAQTMTQSFTIQNGSVVTGSGASSASGENGALTLSEEQKLMFEAPKYMFNHDYRTAENIYSRVIAMDGGNTEAYIQRALVRRELGDTTGVQSDGRTAVIMANNALVNNPNNATLYYQRSMGFRLLKQFAQARSDMQVAMRLKGNPSWDTDMKAIDMEQKIAQSQP